MSLWPLPLEVWSSCSFSPCRDICYCCCNRTIQHCTTPCWQRRLVSRPMQLVQYESVSLHTRGLQGCGTRQCACFEPMRCGFPEPTSLYLLLLALEDGLVLSWLHPV